MNCTIATVATISALTFGSAAIAQTTSSGMGQGYDMLKTALTADFERMGIPTDSLDNLTLAQIAAIKNIIDSDEFDSQDKGQIEAVIENN